MGKAVQKLAGHDLIASAKSPQLPLLMTTEEASNASDLSAEVLNNAFTSGIGGYRRGPDGPISWSHECLNSVIDWASQEKPLTARIINKLSDQVSNFTDNFGVWIEELVIKKSLEILNRLDEFDSELLAVCREQGRSQGQNATQILKSIESLKSSQMANDELVKLKNEYTNIKSKMESIDVSLKIIDKEMKDNKELVLEASKAMLQIYEHLTSPDYIPPLRSTEVDQAEGLVIPSPEDLDDEPFKISGVVDEYNLSKAFKNYQVSVKNGEIEDHKFKVLTNKAIDMIKELESHWREHQKPMTMTELSQTSSDIPREHRLAVMGWLYETNQIKIEQETSDGRGRPKTFIWSTSSMPN
jgi:hypothetical protein